METALKAFICRQADLPAAPDREPHSVYFLTDTALVITGGLTASLSNPKYSKSDRFLRETFIKSVSAELFPLPGYQDRDIVYFCPDTGEMVIDGMSGSLVNINYPAKPLYGMLAACSCLAADIEGINTGSIPKMYFVLDTVQIVSGGFSGNMTHPSYGVTDVVFDVQSLALTEKTLVKSACAYAVPEWASVREFDFETGTDRLVTKKINGYTVEVSLAEDVYETDGFVKAVSLDGSEKEGILPVHVERAYRQKSVCPDGKHHFMCNTVDGRIYCIGGSLSPDTNTVYDPSADTWSNASPPPFSMTSGHAAVLDGRFIYCVCGEQNRIAVYDTREDRWEDLGETPDFMNPFLATVEVNRKIYVIGARWYGDGGHTWEYDIDRGVWTEKCRPIENRVFTNGAAIDGKIYCPGGYFYPKGVLSNALDIYDPVNDVYGRGANTIQSCAVALAVMDGKLWQIGCLYLSTNSQRVGVYDPKLNVWSWTPTPLPQPARKFCGTDVFNGKIYIIGGELSPVSVLEYDPQRDV
jgi:hypothetical protein